MVADILVAHVLAGGSLDRPGKARTPNNEVATIVTDVAGPWR